MLDFVAAVANTPPNIWIVATVADKLEQAMRKRPKKDRTWAAVAREADVPAGWLRSFATGHIEQGDPLRIKAVSDVLGLDYREMLALTDQLGEVETVESAVAVTPDISGALLALVDEMRADRLAAGARDADRALMIQTIRDLKDALDVLQEKVDRMDARLRAYEEGSGPSGAPTQGGPDAPGGARGGRTPKSQAVPAR